MDVEQHAVAHLAFFERLLAARALGDVASDAVVALEPALLVEDRLSAHAEIAQLSRPVVTQEHELGKRLVALEPAAVLLPGLFRQRRKTRDLPPRLADDDIGVELGHVEARHVDKMKVLVLHPVPVRAHVDHAAKALLVGFTARLRLLTSLTIAM